MRLNPLNSLKTAATGIALVAAIITGLHCNGDDKPTGNSGQSTTPAKDWRVDNWVPPDTSGYITFNDGGIKLEMVYVEGGTFTMGCTMPEDELCYFNYGFVTIERCDGGVLQNLCDANEYPAHQVTVDGFYIGKFEITIQQWEDILEEKYDNSEPSNYAAGFDFPTELSNFLNKLNTKTNKKYRLPTEAEWEFAARGGKHSKNRVFAGSDNVNQVASYNTFSIGTKLPNELGIYDMSGNGTELVSDWYAPYTSEPQINPQGPPSGQYRIIRGSGSRESENRVSSRRLTSPSGYSAIRLALDAN